MSKDVNVCEIDEILQDPSAYFEDPKDVTNSPTLDLKQKRQVLEHWEQDARQLIEAAGESMTGGEASKLTAIQACIRELD